MNFTAEFHQEARALVGRRLGLHLPEERRDELDRAFLEGFRASRLPSAEAYLVWLARLPDGNPEWARLASRLTVGETYFFRDGSCFDALEQHVLPALITARRSEGLLRLRLWSAGCATGEEPYSLAILLERLLPDRSHWALTVLGTDVNGQALEIAQRGVYRQWSLRGTPPWLRERYFHPRRGETFELVPRIREMVTFAPLNLADDGYPSVVTNTSAMDLILCRNVLMYFGHDAQRECVTRLRHALVAGGWLVLSPVEASAELLRPLSTVDLPGVVFHRKDCALEVSSPPPIAPPITWLPPALEPPVTHEAPKDSSSEPASAGDGQLLAKARSAADQGQLESARLLAEAAVAQARLDPEAHLLLAAISQELGDIPAARDSLRRALYLAPDSAPAHFILGTLLLRGGERRRGRRCFENAIRILASLPSELVVDSAGGLTAGRLKETAHAYLAEA